MFHRLLLPTDGSDVPLAAVEPAIALACARTRLRATVYRGPLAAVVATF